MHAATLLAGNRFDDYRTIPFEKSRIALAIARQRLRRCA